MTNLCVSSLQGKDKDNLFILLSFYFYCNYVSELRRLLRHYTKSALSLGKVNH